MSERRLTARQAWGRVFAGKAVFASKADEQKCEVPPMSCKPMFTFKRDCEPLRP